MIIREYEHIITIFEGVSNFYFLKKLKVLIDCGFSGDRNYILNFMKDKEVKYILFTHLHYDHCGNVDLFPQAELYAHEYEIEAFHKNPLGAVLDPKIVSKLNKRKLKCFKFLPKNIKKEIKIIETPGHTMGSVCFFYAGKYLFSGDTLFKHAIGRDDLPTSAPEKYFFSLKKLKSYKYEALFPSHNY